MNLVVLTTPTTHHAYFLREVAAAFPVQAVLVETEPAARAPFPTHHPFEDKREEHERSIWFGGGNVPGLDCWAESHAFPSLNSPEAVGLLRTMAPDAVVVFGTGRLRPELIAVCPRGIVNLHGGDPETYRGLDTHLWAVYHGEFHELKTTLHRVNADLDDGEIVGRRALDLAQDLELHQLRQVNTEACLALVLEALGRFTREGDFASTPQTRRGRYYSFMPAVLKELCVHRFTARSRP